MDQREIAEDGKSFHALKSLFNDSDVRSGTPGFSINDRSGNFLPWNFHIHIQRV